MGCNQDSVLIEEEQYLDKIEKKILNYNNLLDEFEKEKIESVNEINSNDIKKQIDKEQEEINLDLMKVRRMIEHKDEKNKEIYEKRLSEINKNIEDSYSRYTDIIKTKINSNNDN